VLVDLIPHGFSPPIHAEVARTVLDAQSAPNEVQIVDAVGDACWTHDDVADPPQEIPLT
jgi:hypothetical protein